MIRRFSLGISDRGTVLPLLFILLIGVSALGYVMYTTEILPAETEVNEVGAARNTVNDMLYFRTAVEQATTNGYRTPVSLGRELPPGDRGQTWYEVSTTENESITLARFNRTCEGDDGSSDNPNNSITPPPCTDEPKEWSFKGSGVGLKSEYSRVQNATGYGYEYGNIYSARERTPEGANGVILRNPETPVVRGTDVTLIVFHGNLSAAAPGNIQTIIAPRSDEPVEFTITHGEDDSTGDLQRPRLTLPTEVPYEEWNRTLASERVENGGHIESITYTTAEGSPTVGSFTDESTNYITIELETGVEYEFDIYVMDLKA